MGISFGISEAILVYYSGVGRPFMAISTIILGVTIAMPALCFVAETRKRAQRRVERIEKYIEKRASSEKEAKELSEQDILTGLPNRRNLFHKIEKIRKGSSGIFAVMMVDLDKFKPINDLHGHHVGDVVLVEIAKRLVFKAGGDAIVARLGGDEFIIGMPARSQIEVSRKAALIVEAMSAPIIHEKTAHSVGASIGIALSRDNQDIKSLIHEADVAMYEAKSTGRGTYKFYNEELDKRSKRKANIQKKLVTAIETSQIKYVYQPIYEMETGKLCGFETYSRWNDAEIGEISPLEFISAGEESGLIEDLAINSFEGAMDLARQLPSDIKVGVNLSIKALRKRITAETMMDIISKSKISPQNIVLEIKESSDLREINRVRNEIAYLRSVGFKLALDDFGSGSSTFSTLLEYSFDVIKLDKSYAKNIGNPETIKVIKAILAMGQALNMEIVAEGIETHEQAKLMDRLGFKFAQGYFYGHPVYLEDAAVIANGKQLRHVVA